VQIAALRRVFGEEPGGETWIETFPRRGYRFIGPVSIPEQGAVTAAPQTPNFATAARSLSPTLPDRPSIAVLAFQNMSGDESLDAYDYFLRGMASLHLLTRDSLVEARRLYQRATELDPNYAPPYGPVSPLSLR
jgi:hypothetical protein